MIKTITITAALLSLFIGYAGAQTGYLPYSNTLYQKLHKEIYGKDSHVHSAIKPFVVNQDSSISRAADSVLKAGTDTSVHNWILRKLLSEHLIEINKKEFSFYGDFLPDLIIGRDFTGKKNTWQNTRGYQFGGTIGKKLAFYTSGYEDQAIFPQYYRQFTEKYGVVPGQTNEFFGTRQEKKDWQYVTASLQYTPTRFLSITGAYDKLFIGDGYRSLLLSDVSSPYPYLRLTATTGKIQYSVIWASLQDPTVAKYSYETGNRKKGALFHYLDWNVNNSLSLGFFDALIWEVHGEAGSDQSLKAEYINPVIALNPLISSKSENNVAGLNVKYEVVPQAVVYGQAVFNSIRSDIKQQWGMQAGIRGASPFGAEGFNYLVEYNTVKPYTFSRSNRIISYSNYNQPLGHPYGANFKEGLAIAGYTIRRFTLTGEALYSKYGLNQNGVNYGKDVLDTTYPTDAAHDTGQGLSTTLTYLDGRLSYLLNPKNNLRLEIGAVYRQEKNVQATGKTTWFTFGLRSSFRNLYQDF